MILKSGLCFMVVVGLAAAQLPTDNDIRGTLKQRVDDERQSVGIVVGRIGPDGRKVVSYGATEKGDSRPLNGDTVFEIGSVTKVFTSLLLSGMVQRGEVALTDPVAKYLPAGTKVPQRNGREITLQDLSTHTSGLPRIPSNMDLKNADDPYVNYNAKQLYQSLASYALPRDPGSQYEYSNLGGGLLGHTLALRAGMDYGALVRDRITGPLGMKDTAIALPADLRARLAAGHDAKLNTVPGWNFDVLAGAGALRSTANDMLTFVGAFLGYIKTPLAPAMAAMLDVRKPTGTPGMEVALAWHILGSEDNMLVWHNGGTGGYRSFIGYDPKTRVGVVVLANAETAQGVDDIGLHLLNPKFPLLPASAFAPPKERKEISVDPKILDRYVGKYQLAPGFILSITREGDHLYAQATGQSKNEVFAESEKDYFLKVVDAQFTFETNAGGVATQVVLRQAGQNIPAKRIE